MAVPHPQKRREFAAARSVIGDKGFDAFDPMVEVHSGQQTVRWRSGNVIHPDAAAGVIHLAEEQSAGFDRRSTQPCAASNFGSHLGERSLADPDLVARVRVVADVIHGPAEPHRAWSGFS
jgi:hypothetical protein